MRKIWIVLLLALTLTGCRSQQILKPDTIVDIPLNPTEPVTQAPTETEAPETEPITQPVTEPEKPDATRPAEPKPTEPKSTEPPPTEQRIVEPADFTPGSLEWAVAEAVNAQRQAAGLKPLNMDAGLCRLAYIRARELTTLLGHTRPDGTGWETVLGSHGYTFTAELLHYGSGGGDTIVGRWMNADAHRGKLLEKSAASVGVAGYTAGGVTYMVVLVVG